MKTISRSRDLEQYGIIPLTGEADNLGYRCLCDLTRAGEALIRTTLGMSYEGSFNGNYNHGSKEDPHTASIMLDLYSMVRPIGIMALITVGRCHTVLVTDKVLFGLERGELYIPPDVQFDQRLETCVTIKEAQFKSPDYEHPIPWPVNCYGEVTRIIRRDPNHPAVGDRNIHTMTGRVA